MFPAKSILNRRVLSCSKQNPIKAISFTRVKIWNVFTYFSVAFLILKSFKNKIRIWKSLVLKIRFSKKCLENYVSDPVYKNFIQLWKRKPKLSGTQWNFNKKFEFQMKCMNLFSSKSINYPLRTVSFGVQSLRKMIKFKKKNQKNPNIIIFT